MLRNELIQKEVVDCSQTSEGEENKKAHGPESLP